MVTGSGGGGTFQTEETYTVALQWAGGSRQGQRVEGSDRHALRRTGLTFKRMHKRAPGRAAGLEFKKCKRV